MMELSPEALPAGTVLDSWQLDGRTGSGAYGVVYRARSAGQTASSLVALKLARHSNDLRFHREVELLDRIQHPCVPRLLGKGTWISNIQRIPYPYFVMQWVDGIRLYDWAEQRPLTSRHALRILAQVARALEATHAAQGLHRDVKGDNILVSPDGQAFLMDFGCGTWAGAASLTDAPLAPGTRIYRSPQALRFHWNHRHEIHTGTRYCATPADDVYALGVTAYRLCTGVYPPLATDPSIVGDDERDTHEVLAPPSQWKPLAPALEALILRMLSETPKDRGLAGELAAAMESLIATVELEAHEEADPSDSSAIAEGIGLPAVISRYQAQWPMAVLSWVIGLIVLAFANLSLDGLWALSSDMTDGGTGGVADAAAGELSVPSAVQESEPSGLRLEIPKEPLPGQRRPPCPRLQINIRGGCWIQVLQASPPCGDSAYEWKGACFSPVAAPLRPSTSGN
jgi:eukaryotic-like serine/threonine-protein kinase